MDRIRSMGVLTGVLLAGVLLAGVLLAMPGAAQTPPSRIGNIWNGIPHEPSGPAVRADESAAGIALPQQKAQQQDQELEQIARQLTGKANPDAGSNGPPPQPPNASGR